MRTSITLSAVLAAALCACGSSQDTDTTSTPAVAEQPVPPAAGPEPAPATAEATPPTDAVPPPEGSATEPTPAAAPAPQMSDAQIAAFLAAANKAEIDSSQLEKKSGKSADVKKLAAEMIKDHTAADKKGKALMAKASIQPDASAEDVKTLESKAQAAIEQLKGLKGAELDKAYVDAQVTMHQEVIDAVDQRLLPAVQNADLKAFMTEIRPKLQAHLDHAKALQAKMGAAGGGGG